MDQEIEKLQTEILSLKKEVKNIKSLLGIEDTKQIQKKKKSHMWSNDGVFRGN